MPCKSIFNKTKQVETGPGQVVCEADPCDCSITFSWDIDSILTYEETEQDFETWWAEVQSDDPEPTEFDDVDGLMLALADLYGGE